MKITTPIVPYLDKLNLNDRMYTEEAIDKMIEDFNSKKHTIYGEIGYNTGDVHLTNVSHVITKLFKKDRQLWAEMKVLETEKGRELEKMIEADLVKFRTNCEGTVNEDKTVNVTKFITVAAIDKSTDAFEDLETLTFD